MTRRFRQRQIGFLLLMLCWMVSCHTVEASEELAPEAGMVLVARDRLPDPRFHDAVILLIQHDKQGSAGLIINRPSRLPLTALFPEQTALVGDGRVVSYGGPVAPKELLVLVGTSSPPPQPARRIMEDLFVTGPGELVDWLLEPSGDGHFRVFTGYAGWVSGQLDAELTRGDWRVLPIDTASLFEGDGARLWETLSAVRLM
jgi:putative transcriptional regulator